MTNLILISFLLVFFHNSCLAQAKKIIDEKILNYGLAFYGIEKPLILYKKDNQMQTTPEGQVIVGYEYTNKVHANFDQFISQQLITLTLLHELYHIKTQKTITQETPKKTECLADGNAAFIYTKYYIIKQLDANNNSTDLILKTYDITHKYLNSYIKNISAESDDYPKIMERLISFHVGFAAAFLTKEITLPLLLKNNKIERYVNTIIAQNNIYNGEPSFEQFIDEFCSTISKNNLSQNNYQSVISTQKNIYSKQIQLLGELEVTNSSAKSIDYIGISFSGCEVKEGSENLFTIVGTNIVKSIINPTSKKYFKINLLNFAGTSKKCNPFYIFPNSTEYNLQLSSYHKYTNSFFDTCKKEKFDKYLRYLEKLAYTSDNEFNDAKLYEINSTPFKSYSSRFDLSPTRSDIEIQYYGDFIGYVAIINIYNSTSSHEAMAEFDLQKNILFTNCSIKNIIFDENIKLDNDFRSGIYSETGPSIKILPFYDNYSANLEFTKYIVYDPITNENIENYTVRWTISKKTDVFNFPN